MNQKEKIRQRIFKIRHRLPEEVRIKKSAIIARRLVALTLFKEAKNILLYHSFSTEVGTHWILNKYMDSKNIFLPHVHEDLIEPRRYRGIDYLKPGFGGIPEPIELGSKEDTENQEMDLIIVPGAGFDHHGTRLGFGKGHYDKYLKRHKKIPKIALAFAEQMVDFIPRDTYDIPVDLIITDAEIYRCNPLFKLP